MAVLHEGSSAKGVLDYTAAHDSGSIGPMIDDLLTRAAREDVAQRQVWQMLASERFSTLAEVHPAWILERLRDESPRIIGIILRSLPSKHVRYMIREMPPMLRERIPSMVESFAVAPPVLEVIRRRFEGHFLPMRISNSVPNLGFEHIYYLKGEELEEVIRETGLAEMAIALAGFSGKGLRAVLNRLEFKDAKHLQQRMRDLSGVSPALARQARHNIIEFGGEHVGAGRMLFEVGLAAVAGAIEGASARLVRLIQQRLHPDDGYLLKRFIDARRWRYLPEVVSERRGLIQHLVATLADEGRINRLWSRFSPDAVPQGSGVPVHTRQGDEETATAADSTGL